MNKAKLLKIGIPVAVAVVAVAGALIYFLGGSTSDTLVPVETVSNIVGMNGGLQNRYAGVVEAQDTLEIELDSSMTFGECYVEVGEEVSEGQKLFSYDTDALELELEQLSLDIERAESGVKTTASTISDLKALLKKATTDAAKLNYSQQIQSYELEQKQAEYDIKSKKLERDKLSDKIDNAIVTAEMAGIIQSISSTTSSGNEYNYGESTSNAYITILAAGEYRIRGNINELNVYDLETGSAVIIRSRLDDSVTWTGVIDNVDIDNPVENSGDNYGYYMSSSDETTSSTKYPFYITLDDAEGLLLGQHVYIEPSSGAGDSNAIWLSEYYIIQEETEDGGAYVWAANSRDKLEKRSVTLGEYNELECKYEILDGLTPEDEIAWPTDELSAGMSVTREGFVEGDSNGNIEDGNVEGDYTNEDDGIVYGDDDIVSGGDDIVSVDDGTVYREDDAVAPDTGTSGSTSAASGTNLG